MSACRRTNDVEALQDGRLAPEHAETLRAHVAVCTDCTEEAVRLADLKQALRPLPETETDASANQVLAGRRRLLAAAASGGDRLGWSRAPGFVLPAVVAALAILVFGVGPWRGKGKATPAEAQDGEPGFELSVTPLSGARWSRASTKDTETVTLADGALRVAVKRHDPSRRVLVELPDGELEDVGTVFSVSVAAGRMHDVSVSEGVVALRLRGNPERRLAAGDSYRADEPAVAAASSSAQASPDGTPESSSTVPPVAHTVPSARVPRASAHEADVAEACAQSSLFEDGVQAFRRGDYASAASTLERFSMSCTHTGHAEDAAYLRMVALARAGRSDEARAQALAYLQRFPMGFRHKEAERLAGE